ncbi:MAG: L-threonine aldolase [Alphaproteobacteria bacterium]|nr:MAG: L-threonine aldolase [Alphaproteobacteria bacterium]
MNFASDNWAGAAAPIARMLAEQSGNFVPAYGEAEIDRQVSQRFCELFERDVAVLTVPTGTAANSLALALAMKPGGIALAHAESHIIADECGAAEFMMGGGGRVQAIGGADGKIAAEALAGHLKRFDPPFLHHGRAVALSLTQATEAGTVYTTGEIAALAAQARLLGLAVHMDGARFANALAHLSVSAADMTWRAGVDMLSFGATKNGCWCAEALILFDPALREAAEYLRKRSGHLFSKARFVSLQLAAYLDGGLWLDLARHANAMADRLRDGVSASDKARLAWKSQANEVFIIIDRPTEGRLRTAGAMFYDWHRPHWLSAAPADDEIICRLVTSFATTPQEVDRFVELIG